MTASDITALSTDWLSETNALRCKCNIQGKASGEMSRLNQSKVLMRILCAKAKHNGDPAFWQKKYEN